MNSEESTPFPTHLPIQLDATCNGYQHLALLANESKIYKVLNLTKTTKKENPEDFYGYIKSQLSIALSEKKATLDKTDPLYESYDRLTKLDINRKIIKIAVLTKPSNAAPITLQRSIKETLIKKEEIDLDNKETELDDNNFVKTN
jgi:DNA-directed RNA polymerase